MISQKQPVLIEHLPAAQGLSGGEVTDLSAGRCQPRLVSFAIGGVMPAEPVRCPPGFERLLFRAGFSLRST